MNSPELELKALMLADLRGDAAAHRTLLDRLSRHLPASGYALEVDGRLKAEFKTRDDAKAGGEELKKRFPMLQRRIYARKSRSADFNLWRSCSARARAAFAAPGSHEPSRVASRPSGFDPSRNSCGAPRRGHSEKGLACGDRYHCPVPGCRY
ncbi:hypothetical protein ACVWXN_007963 [Bradyrhizobium sp. i1.4.4]